MSNAPAFEHVSSCIEQQSSLNRLEARGTLRLALKDAGLDPATVTPSEMAVVVERVIPDQLAKRGVDIGADALRTLAVELSELESDGSGATERPESIFERLGGAG